MDASATTKKMPKNTSDLPNEYRTNGPPDLDYRITVALIAGCDGASNVELENLANHGVFAAIVLFSADRPVKFLQEMSF